MTEAILSSLSGLMEGSVFLMLTGAFLWGLASIVLSPCHLASIPLIVGYIAKKNKSNPKSGILLSILFSLGIFVVLALIGVITASSGRILGDTGKPVSIILAALIICMGLFISGIIPLPDLNRSVSSSDVHGGLFGALLLGLLFGAGLGPCAFAFMIPVLTVSFSLAHSSPFFAVSLVTAYALGHCTLIALAGASAGTVSKWLSFNESFRILKWIRILCGVLVVFAGIYLIIKIV